MRVKRQKVLIGLAVVALVLSIGYTIALVRAKVSLRQAYAALAADGRPMQVEDILPAEIPDHTNGAILFEQASYLLKEQEAPRGNLLEYLRKMAVEFCKDTLEPEKQDTFRTAMKQEHVQTALRLLKQGFERPAFRFNRDYTQGLASTPEARDLRYLVDIERAQARLESAESSLSRQWNEIQRLLSLAHILRQDPTLNSQRYSGSSASQGCYAIQRLCAKQTPDPQDCETLIESLQGLDDIAPLLHALDAQRILDGECLYTLPPERLRELLTQSDRVDSYDRTFFRFIFPVVAFKPRLIRGHATYLQLMHAYTQLCQEPYPKPGADIHQRIGQLQKRSLLTRHLTPRLGIYQRFYCRTAAQVRMTRTGLRLLHYRHDHGDFPAELAALGWALPIDPFSNQPLQYRKEASGFLIYSVFEDQVDNGGVAQQPRQKTDFDMIWRYDEAAS
ncbi:hypothetical protein ACFL6U_02720 [Planctomycetota bacterium]